MRAMDHPEFQVGAWRINPNLGRIQLENNKVTLQPRWMDVLVYLAENADKAVSADDIISHVWGDVEVTQDSVYITVSQLRKVLAQDESIPTYIETIAKRGYRLVAPVIFLQTPQERNSATRRRLIIGTTSVAIIIVTYLASQYFPQEELLPPIPNSIAVLPFVDLNPIEGDNFSLGFADDLIIQLNSIEDLEIMARTSSFSMEARNATAQEIGEQLNVATVLEGNIRRVGNEIQVTAQLIKTADGFHIWADTYRYELGAVSRIQTDIARQVAEGLDLFFPPAYIAMLDPMDAPIVRRTRVNTYTDNDQESPAVVALQDGGYIIAWASMDQDGSNWGVYGQKYDDNGAAVGREFRIHTVTRETQYHVDVITHPDRGFVATWTSWESDGSHWGVVGRRFDERARPTGDDFMINDFANKEQAQTSAVVTKDGRIFIVYGTFGQDGSEQAVFGRWFDSAGNPLADSFQVNSFTFGNQGRAKVALLGDNGMLVVWNSYGQDGSAFGVFGQVFDPLGNSFGPELQINSFANGDQEFPQVAALANGGAVVVWQSRGQDHGGEGGFGVFGQLFDSNGVRVGDEFAINSFTESDQRRPAVTALDNSGFFIVWMSDSQTDTGMDIFGQRFDERGRPVGAELFVNVVTNSYQRNPSPATLVDGTVVVAFQADDWDGSYFGIFQRRLVFSGLSDMLMSGNLGADTFVFEQPFEEIEIVNFDTDIDRIDLSALNVGYESLVNTAVRNDFTIETGRGVIRVTNIQNLQEGHFLF